MTELEELEKELKELKEKNNVEDDKNTPKNDNLIIDEEFSDQAEITPINENEYQLEKVELDENGDMASQLINQQKKQNINAISKNSNFQKLSVGITEKDVATKLEAEDIKIEGQKQKNELEKYKLKLQKKALKEKVKGEVESIKKQNAEERFGYLYEVERYTEIDSETGEEVEKVRYKNFSTNRFINRYKEFTNWYANLTDSTQAIIWKTLKFIGKLAIVGAVVLALYFLIKWLISQGILKF